MVSFGQNRSKLTDIRCRASYYGSRISSVSQSNKNQWIMKRRAFFNWASISLLASYFPVALAACSSSNSDRSTNATLKATEDSISMGTEAELQSAGYLLNEESKVMVVRDSEGAIVALNPTCTHRGCIVEWNQENTLVCPCHNAKFAADGEVLAQPAVEPLATYEVKQENGEILVELA